MSSPEGRLPIVEEQEKSVYVPLQDPEAVAEKIGNLSGKPSSELTGKDYFEVIADIVAVRRDQKGFIDNGITRSAQIGFNGLRTVTYIPPSENNPREEASLSYDSAMDHLLIHSFKRHPGSEDVEVSHFTSETERWYPRTPRQESHILAQIKYDFTHTMNTEKLGNKPE